MVLSAVTGATGFVGAELVRQLLHAGHHVRAIVRHPSGPRAQALMAALAGVGQGKLDLVEGALLDQASMDAAIDGANYVFHVASPFHVDSPDPHEELMRPAVEGTRHVMRAAARSKGTVQRVVLTSSVAAICDRDLKQTPCKGSKFTEEDWNMTSTVENGQAYWASKTAAEREAWALAKEHDLSLVCINPGFVMGPLLTREAASTSTSATFFKSFMHVPDAAVPSGRWTFADVREVAAAHIAAATQPHAQGRYIVTCPHTMDSRGITDLLKRHFPAMDLPDGEAIPPRDTVDATKVQKELGLKLRPTEDTLKDMAECIIDFSAAPCIVVP